MTKKYYAVRKGRKTGIFTTWADCKAQVDGFSGAQYKSFPTEAEARDFINIGKAPESEKPAGERTLKPICISEEPAFTKKEKGLEAYVDGSYFGGTVFGSGAVMIYNDNVIDRLSKKTDDAELAKMRNVAGEIKASEMAIAYALENGYNKLTIYHDYEGVAAWPMRLWKANLTGTQNYRDYVDKAKENINITFISVKGHSGVKYNEEADRLAKAALRDSD
ncbi:MAG: ribonuclease H family protein [Catonella sp.]|nr:ribonuclease H family protein [Catonella sp.]MDY6355955.1 ribonuclease H family protein [Catonella sp.]